jgi:hypothetical protein
MNTKHYFLFISILFASLFTQAQWTTDAENPGIACDFSGIQGNPTAFADDNGGVYVFWLDHRNGNNQDALDVYGQHYDSDGYALWEENGRMIVHHYKRIGWFSANRFDNGEIILGWITDNDGEFGDTLNVQRLDADGMKVWANDLAVANNAGNPIYILGLYGFSIIHDNAGYCISIGVVYYGGSSGNRITRFTSDGVLTGLYDGEPEGTQYNFGSSGLESCFDANNNVYLYYSSGNGSGASLLCLKLDIAGDTIWGPVDVLSGTPGLNYQFKGYSDETGITFIWNGNGDGGNGVNLYARRLNADGTFDWGGASTTICAADGNQSIFFARKKDDNFYICWADGRPGVSPGNVDIYAQKFDIYGTVYWAENGIEAISMNTYIPYPEFAFSDDNSMIICHQTTGGWGFVAQKVLDDGTVAWGENGEQICTPAYNPFYEEHTEVQSGDNTIAVWAASNPGGGSDNIYITRIDNLDITGESEFSISGFKVYPNPASGNIFIDIPENIIVTTISLFDTYGREVFRSELNGNSQLNSIMIPTSDLMAGVYVTRIENGKEQFSAKVVVQ